MQLTQVSFKNHNILGNATIDLLPSDDQDQQVKAVDTTVSFSVKNQTLPNQYTFIIGENGVGKSFFFRTLIYAMCVNSFIDPRHNKFESLDQDDERYGSSRINDTALSILERYGIFTRKFEGEVTDKGKDVLRQLDAQLIYINSTNEAKIVHPNAGFRSFNLQSSINRTENLLLKALHAYGGKTELQQLNKLLGLNKNARWSVSYQLPIAFKGDNGDGTTRLLLEFVQRNSIADFLRMLASLTVDEKGYMTLRKNHPEISSGFFSELRDSGAFFKLFFDQDLPKQDFFDRLADNRIYNTLEELIKRIEITTDQTIHNNFDIANEDLLHWEQRLELADTDDFEIGYLILLSEYQAIRLIIRVDGIPLEDLSSGQIHLIRLFSCFADLPIQDRRDNLIVLYDEPENSLHPRWQQAFPAHLAEIVEKVYGIKNSHFLIATHSPVLLMKAAARNDTNAIRFYRQQQQLYAEHIADINQFSIEELLLDEFKIAYRAQSLTQAVKKALDTEAAGISVDPIKSVTDSIKLRRQIEALHKRMKKQ